VQISGTFFIAVLVYYTLMPSTRYIRTRNGIREEFDEPPSS
jgi:hypothetical protein